MGNKSKQDQGETSRMTDYERSKMLRVQENQERLRQLGIKKIANSLTNLVDSRKTKKTKKKSASISETVPDYPEEVAASIGAPKKQLRTRYIPQLSMNKYANLAKHRIVAPNVSRVSEESCDGMEAFSDSNATKKSRLQQRKEANEQNGQFIDRSAANKNQSRAKVTMGELVLNKKGSQRHSRVFKHNPAKPNSATTSISSGSRKQLFTVDEEDEDDVRSQDVNEREREEVRSEDEENEDIEDEFRSYDVNDADIENYGGEDDENENIEHLFDNSDNEIEDDGSEDDDVELELLQDPQLQKQTAISSTKKRGPTMMHNIHTLNLREVIICNEFGQPIGPVIEENDVVGKFSRFLGTIARTYSYAPLIYNSWHKVPNKDKMWEYVLGKYVVPGDAKDWVLKTIGACWRGHKSRLKKKHFYILKDNNSRLKNRPKCIPEKDFVQLLRLWNKKEEQKRCLIAKTRRMSQKNMHTAGPKSFARIREDMKNEDPNKEPPSLTKLFERMRERKEGHVYADTYDETERLIEKMKNYQAPEEEDGGGQDVSGPVDPFLVVMNKEYNGHRRLFGKGVTNKLIKKVNGGETSYMVPTELMESVKTAIDDEMKRMVELRKQIEDDHERKKLELAEEHKKNKAEIEEMRKEIDDQRDKLVEDAVKMLLEKLPPGVVKKFLASF